MKTFKKGDVVKYKEKDKVKTGKIKKITTWTAGPGDSFKWFELDNGDTVPEKYIIKESMKNFKQFYLLQEKFTRMDSQYLQRNLKELMDDFDKSEKYERQFIDNLKARLNQSYPDGDVTMKNIDDIIKEPDMRKLVSKIKNFKEFLDYILQS